MIRIFINNRSFQKTIKSPRSAYQKIHHLS